MLCPVALEAEKRSYHLFLWLYLWVPAFRHPSPRRQETRNVIGGTSWGPCIRNSYGPITFPLTCVPFLSRPPIRSLDGSPARATPYKPIQPHVLELIHWYWRYGDVNWHLAYQMSTIPQKNWADLNKLLLFFLRLIIVGSNGLRSLVWMLVVCLCAGMCVSVSMCVKCVCLHVSALKTTCTETRSPTHEPHLSHISSSNFSFLPPSLSFIFLLFLIEWRGWRATGIKLKPVSSQE